MMKKEKYLIRIKNMILDKQLANPIAFFVQKNRSLLMR